MTTVSNEIQKLYIFHTEAKKLHSLQKRLKSAATRWSERGGGSMRINVVRGMNTAITPYFLNTCTGIRFFCVQIQHVSMVSLVVSFTGPQPINGCQISCLSVWCNSSETRHRLATVFPPSHDNSCLLMKGGRGCRDTQGGTCRQSVWSSRTVMSDWHTGT